MNHLTNAKRITARGLLVVACAITLAILLLAVAPAGAATTLPVLWKAGGLSAGSDTPGQAARIAVDPAGNVAVVSGPAFSKDLAVTSYTASGTFRWQRTVSPAISTFVGDWIAAAPNGDFVAVGHNVTSSGNPITITIVRYTTDGTLLFRKDIAGTFPSVARLLVDAAGDAYLAFNSLGDGQDIRLHKYNPAGTLLWSQVISTGLYANDIATSLALSPDGADVVLSGNVGATWIIAAFNTTTGVRRWLVTEEGFARDVVVDASRVYVTGQSFTGAGTPELTYYMTVVAYDRATGAKLWRTDKNPADGTHSFGLWIAKAPDGSLVATGQTSRGFLDWYTVALETTGAVRWEAVRDGGLNTNEIPRAVLVLPDGTTVVTGPGGPNLPGGYIQGVTAGYSSNGTLLWEAFSAQPTVWAVPLPSGDVCTTGGYDALITCFQVSGVVKAVMSVTPSTGVAPLSVTFDGSGSTTPNGTIVSWQWSFGDGSFGTGQQTTHVYSTPGTYTAGLTVTDSSGGSGTATATIVVLPNAPAAPSGLTASNSGNLVLLAWQDNSSNETLFHIERCQGVGCANFAAFATEWPNWTTYTDYTTTAGQSYSYRVRASNAGGFSAYSNTASIVAGAGNQPPVAVMSATPTTGVAPLTVNFDGSGSTDPDGAVVSWQWMFGDGDFGTGPQITHVYTSPGTYNVNLTVTDDGGESRLTSTSIVVTTQGASTGFRSPSANAAQTTQAGDNNGYQTNPANAFADDASVATDTDSGTNNNTSYTNKGKDKHNFTNFNFNIPPAAAIQGIQVRLDARADATGGAPKVYVQFSWNGGATWTAAKATATLGATEATFNLGGATDTWGRSWSANDFSNANFRLRIIDVASNTSRDFYLDYVAVNVTYQP
jgi:PKD repeat protein